MLRKQHKSLRLSSYGLHEISLGKKGLLKGTSQLYIHKLRSPSVIHYNSSEVVLLRIEQQNQLIGKSAIR